MSDNNNTSSPSPTTTTTTPSPTINITPTASQPIEMKKKSSTDNLSTTTTTMMVSSSLPVQSSMMNNNNNSNMSSNNSNNSNNNATSPKTITSSSLSEYEGLYRGRSSSEAPAMVTNANQSSDDEQIHQMAINRRNNRARERQIGRAPRLPPSVTMDTISAVFPQELRNRHVKIGHADMQGRRKTMEDATTVEAHYRGSSSGEVFVGVYDGHGGVEAAALVGKELHTILQNKLDQYQSFLQKRREIESGKQEFSEQELCQLSESCNSLLQCVPRCLGTFSTNRQQQQQQQPTSPTTAEKLKIYQSFHNNGNVSPSNQYHHHNHNHHQQQDIADELSHVPVSIESMCSQQVIPILLREAFLETNERVCLDAKLQNGCTASSIYLRPITAVDSLDPTTTTTHSNCMELYVANVGDSRVVLARNGKAIRLTVDHRPNDPDEQRRVADAGGRIINQRVNAILAVTRAIGDVYLQPIVTADPYTCFQCLDSEAGDEFLILACDGIWDVMSDQDAVDLIKEEMDPRVASVKLRDHAYSAGSNDNISVAVVRLRKTIGDESP